MTSSVEFINLMPADPLFCSLENMLADAFKKVEEGLGKSKSNRPKIFIGNPESLPTDASSNDTLFTAFGVEPIEKKSCAIKVSKFFVPTKLSKLILSNSYGVQLAQITVLGKSSVKSVNSNETLPAVPDSTPNILKHRIRLLTEYNKSDPQASLGSYLLFAKLAETFGLSEVALIFVDPRTTTAAPLEVSKHLDSVHLELVASRFIKDLPYAAYFIPGEIYSGNKLGTVKLATHYLALNVGHAWDELATLASLLDIPLFVPAHSFYAENFNFFNAVILPIEGRQEFLASISDNFKYQASGYKVNLAAALQIMTSNLRDEALLLRKTNYQQKVELDFAPLFHSLMEQ